MDNVIKLPKVYMGPSEPTREEVNSHLKELKLYHVDEALEIIVENLFNDLDLAGFPLDGIDAESTKAAAFLVETIRAILLRKYKIIHPFLAITQSAFSIDEESGLLNLSDVINIKLNQTAKDKAEA